VKGHGLQNHPIQIPTKGVYPCWKIKGESDMKTKEPLKSSEVWQQSLENPDFWHGPNGVIINTAALNEREFYYNLIRVSLRPYIKEGYVRIYA
jgi:hypothetical protein